MFSPPEYSFRRNKKIATIFCGKKILRTDSKETKNCLLEAMITSAGEDYERYDHEHHSDGSDPFIRMISD